MPGVSKRRMSSPVRTHCIFLVTPGVFPTFVLFVPLNAFKKLDLPTFGMPTTMTFISKFSRFDFLFSRISCFTSFKNLLNDEMSLLSNVFIAKALKPSSRNCFNHFAVSSLSAKSFFVISKICSLFSAIFAT